MFRAGGKYHGMNEFCPSLPGTPQFVHSFVHFVMTFSVIIPWQHVIWCQKWRYELLGPWPMCPPSFIEIASREDGNLTNLYRPTFTTTTTTTTTTARIIIIAKMKPHNNKIPFPFWGNGIIGKMKPHKNKIPFPFWGNGITRGTVQGHSGSHSLHFVMARRQGIMKI